MEGALSIQSQPQLGDEATEPALEEEVQIIANKLSTIVVLEFPVK
jgi:hypothetical protein